MDIPENKGLTLIERMKNSKNLKYWKMVMLRPANLLSIIVILLLSAMTIFGPLFVNENLSTQMNLVDRLSTPTAEHLLGTDELGRDEMARIIYGAGPTLKAGLIAILMGAVLGGIIGISSGYFGGKIDNLLMALMDILLSFPYFLLVVVVIAILGSSLENSMIAIGIWTTPYYARLIRSSTIRIKNLQFIEAAKTTGESTLNIMLRYVLQNCTSDFIILSTIYFGQAILMGASLGFLGLGAQPPQPEWGAMTATGKDFFFTAPHVLIVPSLFIFVTVLAFNFLGDGLRDAFDKRTGGQ